MGAKQSSGANTPSRVRTYSGSHNGAGPHVAMGGSHSSGSRARARSLGSFATPPAGLGIPSLGNGNGPGAVGGSPDSDSSPDEPGPLGVAHAHALRNITHSLPVHLFALHDDVLTESKGECVICFDELDQGDTIARLPCLCIYHK
ncbi:ZNRF2-like protein, partial [Mya arenaria]